MNGDNAIVMVLDRNFQKTIGRLFTDERTPSKWEALKHEMRVQSQQVPVRVKSKFGKSREPLMTRDIEALVRRTKRGMSGINRWDHETLALYGFRATLKREIRRAKLGLPWQI